MSDIKLNFLSVILVLFFICSSIVLAQAANSDTEQKGLDIAVEADKRDTGFKDTV